MPEYAIQTDEMNHVMELLYHVLKIRITFFAPDGREVNWGDSIKAPCPFCRNRRHDAKFDALCIACDRDHLHEAQLRQESIVYHCHAGLLEGIVPLYDKRRSYLGAIVFGQLADRNAPHPGVKQSSEEEMYEIAKLLRCLGEYICENEWIRQCAAPWSERAEAYIAEHLAEPISLARLAKYSGCSSSTLSHKFPEIMGTTLKKYIRAERIRKAQILLQQGYQIAECAEHLGYSDSFAFSKDFKRVTGYSPLHWKKARGL